MKIAFWSSARRSIGVTSNLACVSIAMAFESSCKTVLLENHYQKNPLENMLIHRREKSLNRNAVSFSRYKGLEHIINQLWEEQGRGRFYYSEVQNDNRQEERWALHDLHQKEIKLFYKKNEKLIKEASVEILINSLYYLPIGNQFNQFIFDYTLNDNILKILWASEHFAPYTFIDTSNENNLSSKIILEKADIVVVTLMPEQDVIEQFFRNYSSLLSKCIILLNGLKNGFPQIKSISSKYSFHLSKIIQVPYNMEYSQAIGQGTVVEFMMRNYKCKSGHPNYPFIDSIRHITSVLQREEDRSREFYHCNSLF